jgi:hypothetical protein
MKVKINDNVFLVVKQEEIDVDTLAALNAGVESMARKLYMNDATVKSLPKLNGTAIKHLGMPLSQFVRKELESGNPTKNEIESKAIALGLPKEYRPKVRVTINQMLFKKPELRKKLKAEKPKVKA